MGKELGGGEGGGGWGKGLFGGLLRNYLSGLRDNKAPMTDSHGNKTDSL